MEHSRVLLVLTVALHPLQAKIVPVPCDDQGIIPEELNRVVSGLPKRPKVSHADRRPCTLSLPARIPAGRPSPATGGCQSINAPQPTTF